MICTVRAEYTTLEGDIEVNQYAPNPFFSSSISKKDIARRDVTMDNVLRKQQPMRCIKVSKEGGKD
jgi:hypothetical protein